MSFKLRPVGALTAVPGVGMRKHKCPGDLPKKEAEETARLMAILADLPWSVRTTDTDMLDVRKTALLSIILCFPSEIVQDVLAQSCGISTEDLGAARTSQGDSFDILTVLDAESLVLLFDYFRLGAYNINPSTGNVVVAAQYSTFQGYDVRMLTTRGTFAFGHFKQHLDKLVYEQTHDMAVTSALARDYLLLYLLCCCFMQNDQYEQFFALTPRFDYLRNTLFYDTVVMHRHGAAATSPPSLHDIVVGVMIARNPHFESEETQRNYAIINAEEAWAALLPALCSPLPQFYTAPPSSAVAAEEEAGTAATEEEALLPPIPTEEPPLPPTATEEQEVVAGRIFAGFSANKCDYHDRGMATRAACDPKCIQARLGAPMWNPALATAGGQLAQFLLGTDGAARALGVSPHQLPHVVSANGLATLANSVTLPKATGTHYEGVSTLANYMKWTGAPTELAQKYVCARIASAPLRRQVWSLQNWAPLSAQDEQALAKYIAKNPAASARTVQMLAHFSQ